MLIQGAGSERLRGSVKWRKKIQRNEAAASSGDLVEREDTRAPSQRIPEPDSYERKPLFTRSACPRVTWKHVSATGLFALIYAARRLGLGGETTVAAHTPFCAADLQRPHIEALLRTNGVKSDDGAYATYRAHLPPHTQHHTNTTQSSLSISRGITSDISEALNALRNAQPDHDLPADAAMRGLVFHDAPGQVGFDNGVILLNRKMGTIDCDGGPHPYMELVLEQIGKAHLAAEYPKTSEFLWMTADRTWQNAALRHVRERIVDPLAVSIGITPSRGLTFDGADARLDTRRVRHAAQIPIAERGKTCSEGAPLPEWLKTAPHGITAITDELAKHFAHNVFAVPMLAPELARHFAENLRYSHPEVQRTNNATRQAELHARTTQFTKLLLCIEDGQRYTGMKPFATSPDAPIVFRRPSMFSYLPAPTLILAAKESPPPPLWTALNHIVYHPISYVVHAPVDAACDSVRRVDIADTAHILTLVGDDGSSDVGALIQQAFMQAERAALPHAPIILDLRAVIENGRLQSVPPGDEPTHVATLVLHAYIERYGNDALRPRISAILPEMAAVTDLLMPNRNWLMAEVRLVGV